MVDYRDVEKTEVNQTSNSNNSDNPDEEEKDKIVIDVDELANEAVSAAIGTIAGIAISRIFSNGNN